MNKIEEQIVTQIYNRLISLGHNVTVDWDRGYETDDKYRNLSKPEDLPTLLEACNSVDECWFMIDAEDDGDGGSEATAGYIWFIWGNGNDGKDCITDHSMKLVSIIEPICEWTDNAQIALLGEPNFDRSSSET